MNTDSALQDQRPAFDPDLGCTAAVGSVSNSSHFGSTFLWMKSLNECIVPYPPPPTAHPALCQLSPPLILLSGLVERFVAATLHSSIKYVFQNTLGNLQD